MPPIRAISLLACLLSLGPASDDGPIAGPPLTRDAYIWQRVWTPALATAIRESTDLVTNWRVLAAEATPHGGMRQIAFDADELRASGKPVVLVVRIDGRLPDWDRDALLAELASLLPGWRSRLGVVAGLEIDYDCGTASLMDYAAFLRRLRQVLPSTIALSVTALPAWLDAPDLHEVLSATDDLVLQVHAVRNPRLGLFDPDRAWDWARRLGRLTWKPFRLALPSYGVRVDWRSDGRIASVESEMSLSDSTENGTELMASPQELAAFASRLRASRPAHLEGLSWFRLPTAADRRAWSPATWRAVLHGDRLDGRVQALTRPNERPGLQDVWLVNDGNSDAALPRAVTLPAGCTAADGVDGYTLDHEGVRPILGRTRAGLLPGGEGRLVGWMRCMGPAGDLHAED